MAENAIFACREYHDFAVRFACNPTNRTQNQEREKPRNHTTMPIPITLQDRYRGSLLGLAAGDALGTTLEFRSPGTFEPIDDLIGGGPFNLRAGDFTDDTSMALCLAESLIECNGFEATDAMQRFVRWWRHGHLSCTGECFDIGMATSAALELFERSGDPFAGDTNPQTAGNGSIDRKSTRL